MPLRFRASKLSDIVRFDLGQCKLEVKITCTFKVKLLVLIRENVWEVWGGKAFGFVT